jgi:hypothetical protein
MSGLMVGLLLGMAVGPAAMTTAVTVLGTLTVQGLFWAGRATARGVSAALWPEAPAAPLLPEAPLLDQGAGEGQALPVGVEGDARQ